MIKIYTSNHSSFTNTNTHGYQIYQSHTAWERNRLSRKSTYHMSKPIIIIFCQSIMSLDG